MKRISIIFSCLFLTGCCPQKAGPYNLLNDSISYNHAVQASNDSQFLLNILRLRYRDTPTFLEIGLISAAYENTCGLETEFGLSALNRTNSSVSITPNINIERKEKPTIAFQAIRGEGFVREFLSPFSLQSLVLLNSSGWKIDRIMRCCVQRLNGVKNAPTASGPTPFSPPEYELFLELSSHFAELEKTDSIDLILKKHEEGDKVGVFLAIDKKTANPRSLQRIWEILEVEPGVDYIRLNAYHGRGHGPNEVNVDLRSPLSLLYFLSHSVEIPEIDKALGKVTRTESIEGTEFSWDQVLKGIMKVHTGPIPCNVTPAAAICYRGHYFYIDDSDLDSKSTFSMLSQLFALQITCPNLPVTAFTIPLNN